jgi:hypothetical protein
MVGIFGSCIDDNYDLNEFSSDKELKTSLVGPIGESRISIKDLLMKMDVDSTTIKEYSGDKLLYFYYDALSRIDINPLEINIEGFRKEFVGNGDIDLQNLAGGRMVFDEELNFDINQDSEFGVIDSILVRNTLLEIDFSSTIPDLLNELLDIEITIPDQIKLPDGRKSITISKPGNSSEIISLDGAILDFTKGTTFDFEFEATVQPGSITLTEGSRLEIGCRISGGKLLYKQIWGIGDFEPQPRKESMSIDLFEELAARDINLKLTDPRLFINGITNIGAPTTFVIDYVHARNIQNNTSLYAVFSESGTQSYQIPFKWTEVEGVLGTSFEESFTNDAVNLSELIGISPDSLELQYTIEVGGEPSPEGNYFITNDAFIALSWGLEIPTWFDGGSYIYLKDTLAVDLGSVFENDIALEKGVLYFDLENGLPFYVDVNLQFMEEDEIGNIIPINNPDLSKDIRMEAAKVDPVNKTVTQAVKTKEKFELNSTMQEDLKRVKHLQIYYKIQVQENVESAKITAKDFLKVKINAYLKAGIKL